MLQRIRDLIGDVLRQADLVLLGLCCAATVFGMVEIASATHYMGTWKNVIVQGGAAVIGIAAYIALSVVFSIVSQPFAAHRAEAKGVSREQYLKRERIWAIVCVIILIVALAWATYYNLDIRTVLK